MKQLEKMGTYEFLEILNEVDRWPLFKKKWFLEKVEQSIRRMVRKEIKRQGANLRKEKADERSQKRAKH